MAGYRMNRITEDVHRTLTDILGTVKDPRVKAGLVSIVRCEVTNDLSLAKIYVSSVEGGATTKSAVEGLKSGSGYIRRELANRLHLRHTPELKFIADDSIAHGAEITKMLSGLAKEEGDDSDAE